MVTPVKCLAANFPLNEPDDFYGIGEAPNRTYKYHIEVHMLVSDYVVEPFAFFEAWINLTGEAERFFVYCKREGISRSVVICSQTEAEHRTATQSEWDDTKSRHAKEYYKHEKEKRDEEKKQQRSVDASSSKAKFIPNSLTKEPPKDTPYAKGRGSGNRHFNYDLLEPTINVEDLSAPPSSTILSTACSVVHDGSGVHDGAVSLRDPADNGIATSSSITTGAIAGVPEPQKTANQDSPKNSLG